MEFPRLRPRRLRRTATLRRMVRETGLSVDDLVYPIFVMGGENVRQPITTMPGICRLSVDKAVEEALEAFELGLPAVILFGIPTYKDAIASAAYDPEEAVQRAVRAIKDRCPELLVITDVCLCEYTDHGHCGVVENGRILNDPTLELLAKTALSHATAGADIVAPSDMMDGRVGVLRSALDEAGYTDVAIMSYAAKYASAFYWPFREAAGSAPRFGDRRSYQMDPPNVREAMKEVEQDLKEGADIVMVKPALAYLDVIRAVRERFFVPVAAYNVSGEYAMVKASAASGGLDEEAAVMEILTAIKRAGADIIITYHAKEVARLLREKDGAGGL